MILYKMKKIGLFDIYGGYIIDNKELSKISSQTEYAKKKFRYCLLINDLGKLHINLEPKIFTEL